MCRWLVLGSVVALFLACGDLNADAPQAPANAPDASGSDSGASDASQSTPDETGTGTGPHFCDDKSTAAVCEDFDNVTIDALKARWPETPAWSPMATVDFGAGENGTACMKAVVATYTTPLRGGSNAQLIREFKATNGEFSVDFDIKVPQMPSKLTLLRFAFPDNESFSLIVDQGVPKLQTTSPYAVNGVDLQGSWYHVRLVSKFVTPNLKFELTIGNKPPITNASLYVKNLQYKLVKLEVGAISNDVKVDGEVLIDNVLVTTP